MDVKTFRFGSGILTCIQARLISFILFLGTNNANWSKMVRLTEDMIVARTRVSDMNQVKKLNCW